VRTRAFGKKMLRILLGSLLLAKRALSMRSSMANVGVAADSCLQPLMHSALVTRRARRPPSSRFSSDGGGLSGERCGAPHDGHKPPSPLSWRISSRTRQVLCRLENSSRAPQLERGYRSLLLTPLQMTRLRIHERSCFSSHILPLTDYLAVLALFALT
jgi:hypothetical protein